MILTKTKEIMKTMMNILETANQLSKIKILIKILWNLLFSMRREKTKYLKPRDKPLLADISIPLTMMILLVVKRHLKFIQFSDTRNLAPHKRPCQGKF